MVGARATARCRSLKVKMGETSGHRAGAVVEAQGWNLGQVRAVHRLTPSSLGSRPLSATRAATPQVSGVRHGMGTLAKEVMWARVLVGVTYEEFATENKPL